MNWSRGFLLDMTLGGWVGDKKTAFFQCSARSAHGVPTLTSGHCASELQDQRGRTAYEPAYVVRCPLKSGGCCLRSIYLFKPVVRRFWGQILAIWAFWGVNFGLPPLCRRRGRG